MLTYSEKISLEQEAKALADELGEMRHKAEKEQRDLSRREEVRVSEIVMRANAITAELKTYVPNAVPGDVDPRTAMGTRRLADIGSAVVLAPEQRLADWQQENSSGYAGVFASELNPNDVSLGKLIRGMVTGDWREAELEQRALAEGVGSTGGFLTPEPLAARFLDRVRNATKVVQAGAQTVPMKSDTLNIPRLTTGATVAWKTENDPLGKMKESTGAYQTPPAVIDTVKRLVSNQVPTTLTVGSSNDCSEVYIADWSHLLIGVRTDLRFSVRVLDQRFADNLQVGLLTYLRADVQLAHPEAFNVMTGVRP